MNRPSNSRTWKLAVKIALACVLAADASLIAVSWEMSSEAPQSQSAELARLAQEAQLLSADVQKGQTIEEQLPNLTSESAEFYNKDLLPSASGYASIISDIAQMARQAGVQTSGLGFHEIEVKDRALKQVEITSAVTGDYQSMIRLIDELERSPHFYLLDQLALTSENSGVVKLQLNLRTYFRT